MLLSITYYLFFAIIYTCTRPEEKWPKIFKTKDPDQKTAVLSVPLLKKKHFVELTSISYCLGQNLLQHPDSLRGWTHQVWRHLHTTSYPGKMISRKMRIRFWPKTGSGALYLKRKKIFKSLLNKHYG